MKLINLILDEKSKDVEEISQTSSEVQNKKEPITILSVEVVSCGTEANPVDVNLDSGSNATVVMNVFPDDSNKNIANTEEHVFENKTVHESKTEISIIDKECVTNQETVVSTIDSTMITDDAKGIQSSKETSTENKTEQDGRIDSSKLEVAVSTIEETGHVEMITEVAKEEQSCKEASNEIISQKSNINDNCNHGNVIVGSELSATFVQENSTKHTDMITDSLQTINETGDNTDCGTSQTIIQDNSKNALENLNDSTLSVQTERFENSSTIFSNTGLSLLAQYGSDNDTDTESVIEVPLPNQDYRNNVVEIDSESAPDSDSDSSSGSDVEYLNVLRKKIEKRMEVDDDDDYDEGENEGVQKKKPRPKVRAKGEMLIDDLPPIQDLQITVPEDECIELGKIHSIVDQLVLVSALPNSVLLDLDTVLFLDKGQKVLGEVFDVLGQVADPLYCIRFNSNSQINEKNIKVGDTVYVAPKTEYTQFIILSSLMNMKGSDASWENDIEPPPRYLDYSDDEQEQLARRQMRNRDRPTDHDDPEKRRRTDADTPQISSSPRPSHTQYRHRQPFPRGAGEVSNYPGSYGRPPHPHQSQYQNQHSPVNHHPSSWHSNYYPQSYPVPPHNYGYSGYPPMPSAQGYPQAPSMYPMPSMHPVRYPVPPPHHMGPTINNAPVPPPHMVPGAFTMRPPTMGHFDPSSAPPGAQ